MAAASFQPELRPLLIGRGGTEGGPIRGLGHQLPKVRLSQNHVFQFSAVEKDRWARSRGQSKANRSLRPGSRSPGASCPLLSCPSRASQQTPVPSLPRILMKSLLQAPTSLTCPQPIPLQVASLAFLVSYGLAGPSRGQRWHSFLPQRAASCGGDWHIGLWG